MSGFDEESSGHLNLTLRFLGGNQEFARTFWPAGLVSPAFRLDILAEALLGLDHGFDIEPVGVDQRVNARMF